MNNEIENTYLMDITFSNIDDFFTIEFPPEFTSDLQNITIDTANTSSSFIYTFPPIMDINDDTFSMLILNLPDFIEFNEFDKTLFYDSKTSS